MGRLESREGKISAKKEGEREGKESMSFEMIELAAIHINDVIDYV